MTDTRSSISEVEESNSSLPPVPQEQAFLETYFLTISQFAYDKAKESADKEKDARKNTYGTTWGQMLFALSHLATAEKTYSSLLFLGQKWFGRKDSLRTSYSQLYTELRKIENIGKHAMGGTAPQLEELLAHLCGQLCQYIHARQDIMDFYEMLSSQGGQRSDINYCDLVNTITERTQRHSKSFHHPILSPLKTSITQEFDCLQTLLQAELEMSQWKFLQSLFKLHDVNTKLEAWGIPQLMKEQPKKRLSSPSHKTPPVPPLYQWLIKYKDALMSKFSLYFHEILSKQAPVVEIKSLLSKLRVDYYSKFVSFHKKSDAFNISLVFHVSGCEDTYKGHGYHHPESVFEPATGLDSYPAVVSYPHDRPANHWPNVVMLMTSRQPELSTPDRLVYFYDKHFQSTYYISKVDVRMTLVIIYDTKKNEKDSYVNAFMTEMSSQLRSNKSFASLKPGSRS
ncbi:KICSTOR subunit 2-like [Glandiceps talaboti]